MSIALEVTTYLKGIPPELATIIMSMLPIIELRGALPVALTVYKFSFLEAMFWAVLGNMLPVYFLLVLFERVTNWLRPRSPFIDRLLTTLFERTRHKLEHKVEKYGTWALTLFVAVPLPVTGAWTGALAAFVFGLPKKKAFFAILAGVIIAAFIVATLTIGTIFTVNGLRG